MFNRECRIYITRSRLLQVYTTAEKCSIIASRFSDFLGNNISSSGAVVSQ